MCVKILVLSFVISSMCWAQPTKVNVGIGNGNGDGSLAVRKSCGRELVTRVDRVCQNRGGHMSYTRNRRVRRGIVNECCMNKCADYHLYAYCSGDQQERKSSKTDSSLEAPAFPIDSDLDVAESRASKQKQFFPSNAKSVTVTATASSVDKISLSENPRYNDVLVNGNIDTEMVDRIMKALPRNSNDYQIGTVPPEYQISHYIPSRVRISTNY